MRDEIISLWRKGLTYREIASRVGTTRSTVAGHVHRHRYNTPPIKLPPLPARDVVQAALDANGGNLSATGRVLGVSRCRLRKAGFKAKIPAPVNLAKDPETYALVLAIDMSGLSDRRVTEGVEMSKNTIRNWRYGKFSASPFLAQCVRTVINTPGY